MTSTETSRYEPISCDFHDVLETLATTRREALIRFVDEEGAVQQRHAGIADVYAREGVEYLLLTDGERLRLDRLLSVDESHLKDFG